MKINSSVESNSPRCYFFQRRLVARPIRRDPGPGQNNTPLLIIPLSGDISPSEECDCVVMGLVVLAAYTKLERCASVGGFKAVGPA